MGSPKALQMTRTGFRRSASGLAPLWDMFRWLLGQIYIYIGKGKPGRPPLGYKEYMG